MGLFKSRLDNCNNSERSSRRFLKNSNEAPYQMLGKRTIAATFGYKELANNYFWLSLLSECISCFLYVFIVCSTRISWTGSIIGHEPNLLAIALSSGISMMLLIFTFRTVHVNPALTISFLLTGRIPIIRALLYVIAHCFGSVAAIAFLYSISIEGHSGALGLDNPHEMMDSWQILIVELVISFVVTIATYATCNYSSYTCAKKSVLEELGQSSSLFQSNNINNNTNNSLCDNSNIMSNSQLRHSRHTVVPIVPQRTTNSLIRPNNHLQSKGFLLNSYHEIENGNSYDYEYDNHRIYATQQSRSESSPQVPTEEVIQDECQLLAPNGFSIYMTSGQALVIGLAYTLTSLSGIPASGASLNPARSFGPAFIMNRWERHWIYWLGPILGAVIAGFFYDFIFSPTRKCSLCYRPKLFRFSAQDMAKVGSRSRYYQQQQQQHQQQQQQHHHHQQQQEQQQRFSNQPSTSLFRLQNHNQTMLHSPSARGTAILNIDHAMLAQQQQQQQDQVVYDDPDVENIDNRSKNLARDQQFGGNLTAGQNNRHSMGANFNWPSQQQLQQQQLLQLQRFEQFGLMGNNNNTSEGAALKSKLYTNHNHNNNNVNNVRPFNTVHHLQNGSSSIVLANQPSRNPNRPNSMVNFQNGATVSGRQLAARNFFIQRDNNNTGSENEKIELDEEFYNVLAANQQETINNHYSSNIFNRPQGGNNSQQIVAEQQQITNNSVNTGTELSSDQASSTTSGSQRTSECNWSRRLADKIVM